MRGPELGVQPDDIEAPEIEHELKQEVLENKNVRVFFVAIECFFSFFFFRCSNYSPMLFFLSGSPGRGSTGPHRRARKNQGRHADL